MTDREYMFGHSQKDKSFPHESFYFETGDLVFQVEKDHLPVKPELPDEPCPCERFYFETGDLVFQVEKVLFKVHRHFLAAVSPILRDMLKLPQPSTQDRPSAYIAINKATERPLFMLSESVHGWKCILALFYRTDLFDPVSYQFGDWKEIIPIAHKYFMTDIEQRGIQFLRKNPPENIQLIWLVKLAQEIKSEELYEQAIKGLADWRMLKGEEAREIGFKAFYEVMLRKQNYNQYQGGRNRQSWAESNPKDFHW
ncbi:hypothetical protein FRC14_000379 [Serendipita sp. 396]|nr:hypothetical protein FRC14_000379 [Serendipita sp. 396]KAG8781063.1 hypothetical protein FRC15_009055 [Serendipita sp. 397]KAG8816590.1 hypothetical protein FRC19_011939 [Serendipita sp. 401]KAG8823077.1 hypothetical protein FRC18_010820 [Serendipita sp. 400]KAG8856984.1 hypothetical protein FRC20_000382 [Serendipita sp. 405]KAG9030482.1 hypothetical protein FS842_004374 [Serendipita sp. 407]